MMGLQQNIGDNKKKVSEPEDRTIEIIQPDKKEKDFKITEQHNLWNIPRGLIYV